MMDIVTEQELEAVAVAPRVTEQSIEAKIVGTDVFRATGTLTIAVLTLLNGFTVTGESACASPENYNEEIGTRLARADAFRKIWALEGYLLRDQLHRQEQEAKFAAMDAELEAKPHHTTAEVLQAARFDHESDPQ